MARVGHSWGVRPEMNVTPHPKPTKTRKRRRPVTDMEAAARFKEAVSEEPCLLAHDGHRCVPPMQAMHVVPKQALKRRGLHDLLWDPANGVNGCYEIHRRHDNCTEKIGREFLPARCVEWAAVHGLSDVLERHWP